MDRADRPNELWVVDFTYVPTWSGMAFTTFITGVIQHSDAGAQYTALRYSERLADVGAIASIATEIATTYGAPLKKVMGSWVSSLNYVRNVSAHHARLFNRKLDSAPARPTHKQVPILGHLEEATSAKQVFGVYNALAVMAYLLRVIDPNSDWPARVAALIQSFPNSAHLATESMGVPPGWLQLELWSKP